jgi:hypothetical protein
MEEMAQVRHCRVFGRNFAQLSVLDEAKQLAEQLRSTQFLGILHD